MNPCSCKRKWISSSTLKDNNTPQITFYQFICELTEINKLTELLPNESCTGCGYKEVTDRTISWWFQPHFCSKRMWWHCLYFIKMVLRNASVFVKIQVSFEFPFQLKSFWLKLTWNTAQTPCSSNYEILSFSQGYSSYATYFWLIDAVFISRQCSVVSDILRGQS